MSLPQRYGRRVRELINSVAVWQPGTPVPLGTIMELEDGNFNQLDELASFTGIMKSAPHLETSLDLKSDGVRQRLFQAGAELTNPSALDLNAEASVKIEFTREFDYLLKTPTLKGEHITNLIQVANAVRNLPNWEHKRFYIVHKVFDADEFSFLGNEKSQSAVEISGKGAAIASFLNAGAAAGVSKSGSARVEILGKGGSVAMGLVRIKRDGQTDFVP